MKYLATHRFHEIDLLRGCACVMVIAFHYLYRGQQAGWITSHPHPVFDAIARYGYLGVHLFFIISGFVIFMSAQSSTVRSFIASRVARIYPAFWVAALLTTLTVWWVDGDVFQVSTKQLAFNLTMAPHWFGAEFVDGAYWSLAVELHFYILVTLIIASGWMQRSEWLMTGWLLISVVNYVRPIYPLQLWLCVQWAPFFSAGICSYLIRVHGCNRRRLMLLTSSYLLAVAYAVKTVGSPSQADDESVWVTGGLITTFFVVFGAIAFDRWRLRASRLTLWAGLMTYPVYLLHHYIGYILLEALKFTFQSFGLRLLIVCIVISVAAWIVVQWVEKPLRPRLRQLLCSPGLQSTPA